MRLKDVAKQGIRVASMQRLRAGHPAAAFANLAMLKSPMVPCLSCPVLFTQWLIREGEAIS